MGYDYDKLYRSTPNALGAPTQAFVDFFNRDDLQAKMRVLDVGCGQGRDALFIARLGHSVFAVDMAQGGIDALSKEAREEGLAIEAIVADITKFRPNGLFDIVLVDRTLHMLPEAPRISVLFKLLGVVRNGGWILIADEKSNMNGFKAVMSAMDNVWNIEKDGSGLLFGQQTSVDQII